MKNGVESYLTNEETNASLNQSLDRWKERIKLNQKLGNPIFSVTRYQKVYRITLPFEDGILGVSTEPEANIYEIIEKIVTLIFPDL